MGAVIPFTARSVLPFRARSAVPVGAIANGLCRVAKNFQGPRYDSGVGEPVSSYMARAKPMDGQLRKDNPGIPLEFDPGRQHLTLALPHQSGQRVHVLAEGNDHYQVTLTDDFETDSFPYFHMTRERRVILNGEGQRVRPGQNGLDEFFLKVTATDVLLKGLFEAMGQVSEHTLASRAYVAARFLMTLYEAPESTSVVLLANEKRAGQFVVLKSELLAEQENGFKQLVPTLGARADGFDLMFVPNRKEACLARILFTNLQDDRDPELVIWLSEDVRLTRPALLREGLLHLFARSEAFLKQQEAQADTRLPARLP